MAISDAIKSEVARKAKAGISLTSPTAEKTSLYNSYSAPKATAPKPSTGNQYSSPGFVSSGPSMLGGAFNQARQISQKVQQQQQNQLSNSYQQFGGGGSGGSNKTNSYIPAYNPNAQVADNYVKQAGNEHYMAEKDGPYKGYTGGYLKGSEWMGQDQLKEIGYYQQQKEPFYTTVRDQRQAEIAKGYGLADDWAQYNPQAQEAQKAIWAIDDFIADKFNSNGVSDLIDPSLNRDTLGFNESGARSTNIETQTEQALTNMGVGTQQAFNMARGINGFTKHVVQNGQVIDTGQTRPENAYDNLGGGEFFNDPRNQGKQFNWMNYINPAAQQGGSVYDGSGIDYYNANRPTASKEVMPNFSPPVSANAPQQQNYQQQQDYLNFLYQQLGQVGGSY